MSMMSHNFGSFIEEVEADAETQPIRASEYHSHQQDLARYKGAKSRARPIEQIPFKQVKNYDLEQMKKRKMNTLVEP
jgi:hypothetical protein